MLERELSGGKELPEGDGYLLAAMAIAGVQDPDQLAQDDLADVRRLSVASKSVGRSHP